MCVGLVRDDLTEKIGLEWLDFNRQREGIPRTVAVLSESNQSKCGG